MGCSKDTNVAGVNGGDVLIPLTFAFSGFHVCTAMNYLYSQHDGNTLVLGGVSAGSPAGRDAAARWRGEVKVGHTTSCSDD